MKYNKGELVVDTFCQWNGRDEVTACREKIPPYPYAGTVKKSCCEFHQYAFALSYSIEEIQRIIRFKMGNPAWKHPLRFTDIINSTLMALKGADIDSIVSEVYNQATIHYLDRTPVASLEEGISEQAVKQYIKGLLNAFFMFPIVYDRFFAPRIALCAKNPELPLLSPSILSLGIHKKQLLPSDLKMISSDLKYNCLKSESIALSWGFRTSLIDEINKEYEEASTPPPQAAVTQEPVQPEKPQVANPPKAQLSKEQVEEELKNGKSVIIEVNGVQCRLSPVKEDLKKTYTEYLPLSQRLINVLVANKLHNLSEILEYFDGLDRETFLESDKFMQLHNFGRKSAREVFEFLSTLQRENEDSHAK